RDAAADLTAEVFTTAWRRIEHMPTEPDSLPWLYGVARKMVANHHRAMKRQRALHLKAVPSTQSVGMAADDPIVVRRELEQMRPDDQEILRLAAWEDLGATEIAAVLDLTPEAARVRLHRARRRLAERLGTNLEGTN
ncbi:MAG: sigma-70 family RNA polymerase sigma factor, partial [Acidimicrobiia bacterium]|nr:sigma-70 family RNA polymerase sigma factor [Acidimicrobiia bacterium]